MTLSKRKFVTVSGYEKPLPATKPTAALSDLMDATIELETKDRVHRNSILEVRCEEAGCFRLSSAFEGLILETLNTHSGTAGQAFHFLRRDLLPCLYYSSTA